MVFLPFKAYYRDAVAAFVVYDVTNKNSLEHSLQWKEEINSTVYLTNGDPIPVVLIANKVCLGHVNLISCFTSRRINYFHRLKYLNMSI